MKGRLVLVAAALLLGGCAFPRRIGDIAMDYNTAIARTVDETTLLNIMRAKERQPLHFTAISALRGNVTATAQLGLGAAVQTNIGNAGSIVAPGAVLSPNGSLGVTSEPSFDVAVLNSQEFQKGVLQPVTAQLLDYLLEQGWPPDFLTALFVKSVEYRAAETYPDYAAGDLIETVDNRPDRPSSAAQFGQFLTCFALRPVSVLASDVPVVDFADLGRASSLGDLQLFSNGNLVIRNVDEKGKPSRRMVVRPQVSTPGLALASMTRAAADSCTLPQASDGEAGDGAPIQLSGFRTQSDTSADAPAVRSDAATLGRIVVRNGAGVLETRGKSYHVVTEMVLRSPLGVMYFLGEYARAAEPYRVRGMKLIDIREGAGPDAFVRTQLGGRHYYLRDKDDVSRSLQTIALVEQVINLQKSASELPSTGAVQIVR